MDETTEVVNLATPPERPVINTPALPVLYRVQYAKDGEFPGMITSSVAIPTESLPPDDNPDEWLHLDAQPNLSTSYIVDEKVVERPAMSVTLDGLKLSGLPVPSKLRLETETYDVTESDVELEFSHPGKYKIMVTAWPYKNYFVEITV